MTVAQTKAKRRFWTKIDKRYRSRVKDEATQKLKAIRNFQREQERTARGAKKKE